MSADLPLARLTLVVAGPYGGTANATFELDAIHLRLRARQAACAGSRMWRGLIVGQRLLSRPELVWSGAFPAPPAAPPLPADEGPELAAALAELHGWYALLTRVANVPYSGITSCAECLAGQRAYDEAFRARARRSRARHKPRLPRNRHPAYCRHAPLALEALLALTRQSPELTFELLGWIAPAGDRFVLAENALRIVLGHWLLGKTPDQLSTNRRWGAPKKARQTIYRTAVRRSRAATTAAVLSPLERSALAFSASIWGITTPVEGLVAPGAPSLPTLDPRAGPVIGLSFELPPADTQPKRARKAPAR